MSSQLGPSGTAPTEEAARLARRLDDWLTRADRLAQSARATDVEAVLRHLAERHHAPGFRVAVVGEFNRGKSTLVNRLLDRPLLPVGDVPTTALMTSVVAGAPERLEVVHQDGSREQRAIAPEAWADLVADQPIHPSSESARIVDVRLVVENAWLRELDAEVVDTPGAGDLAQERMAVLYETLAQTDAAVFVVSALLPFSMTERTFLEHQVLGRHISRVIVVVSQLDKVPEDERESVMRSVETRVGQVAPQVPIVSSHPVSAGGADADAADAYALEEVRALINGLAVTSRRVLWRSRQIAEQLIDSLDGLIGVGQTAIQAATMDAAQRAEALRQQRNATLAAEIQWNQISTQLDQRAASLEGLLRKRIAADSQDVLQYLDNDLRKADDPKLWWDKQYRYLLAQRLAQLGQRYESDVLSQVNEDIDWLRATVEQSTSRRLSIAHLDAANTPSLKAPKSSHLPHLRDWRQMRILSRLGLGAATVVFFFFLTPISAVVTLGAGVVSEQLINAQEKQQREIIRTHMATLVSEASDRYAVEIAARVRRIYAEFSGDLREEQAAWAKSAEAVIERNDAAGHQAQWEQMIVEADHLRDEVISALAE